MEHIILAWFWDAIRSQTLWTAVATLIVALYTYYAREQSKAMVNTLSETKRSADAAKEALLNSREQLRISVRPRVGITDEPGGLKTTPIQFDSQGNATIHFSVTVKNYGNYAAQNVMVVIFLMVTEDLDAIRTRQVETRGDNYVGKRDMGFVLFPGGGRLSVNSASSFERSAMISKSYTEKFEAYLVGCIGYRDQFGALYRTNFIYWLVHPNTMMPIEFDAVPNSKIQGVFIPWHSFLD